MLLFSLFSLLIAFSTLVSWLSICFKSLIISLLSDSTATCKAVLWMINIVISFKELSDNWINIFILWIKLKKKDEKFYLNIKWNAI